MKDNVERLDIKRLATLTIVAFVWLEVLMQFGRAMAPRLLSVATGGPVVNTSPCYSPDCDFSIFWPAGVLARAGDFAGIYAPLAFLALRHHLLFAGAQRLDWIYPPPSLLPAAAVSLFSFQVAFWVSTVGLAAAAVARLRWTALPWSVIVVSFVSPAALWNFEMG
jgi:hypothetical protein